jgi:hypothetical protein
MAYCNPYQFSEIGTNIEELTFVVAAADGSSEPILTDAAKAAFRRRSILAAKSTAPSGH